MRDKQVFKRISVATSLMVVVLLVIVTQPALRALPPFIICAIALITFFIMFFQYPTPITFDMLSKAQQLEQLIADSNIQISKTRAEQQAAEERIALANQKEAALKVSSHDFIEQAQKKESELANLQRALKKSENEISMRRAELEQYEKAIYHTERTIRNWVKLREEDEIAIFNEISTEVDKYKQYSESTENMNGHEFEEYIAQLLKQNGYSNVIVTQKAKDFGSDVIADLNGIKHVIQCKYYSSPVGLSAVQEAYTAKAYYNAHAAVVVTNITFTKAAKALAEKAGVALWDCEHINKMKKT